MTTRFDDGTEPEHDDPLAVILRPPTGPLGPPPGRYAAIRRAAARRRMLRAATGIGLTGAVAALIALPLHLTARDAPESPTAPHTPPPANAPAVPPAPSASPDPAEQRPTRSPQPDNSASKTSPTAPDSRPSATPTSPRSRPSEIHRRIIPTPDQSPHR